MRYQDRGLESPALSLTIFPKESEKQLRPLSCVSSVHYTQRVGSSGHGELRLRRKGRRNCGHRSRTLVRTVTPTAPRAVQLVRQ
ncbi:hypothetical protein GDO86_018203 [Hymenochirus boettgeri]|uniref:Uncharacterized protein n=1 Tax=Hymenochirus boettgeri TaxID=247094 RepID=A0A8T2IDI2_9PIPI|nr:hypothetical protein GDO86_018203 [Hymenochirus boettgeri]